MRSITLMEAPTRKQSDPAMSTLQKHQPISNLSMTSWKMWEISPLDSLSFRTLFRTLFKCNIGYYIFFIFFYNSCPREPKLISF